MTTGEVARDKQTPHSSSGAGILKSSGRAWGMTGLVVFLYIVNWGDKVVLGVIAQPLARELGLTASQIGLAGSLFFLAFTIGGFFAGPINKYVTLRWSLLALAVAWSVVMLPLVVAASVTMLIVSRMLLGLAEGPSAGLMHTATYSWHPPAKRGLPSALLTGASSMAKIALAPILTFVTIEYGWRTAVLGLCGLGAVWAVCWLASWSEGPYAGKASAELDSDIGGTEPSAPWRTIFLSRTFVSCAVLVIVVYALVTMVLTWLPSYFEVGLGFSAMQAGSLFALPSIVSLVLMIMSGAVTDRLRQRGASARLVRIIVPCIGVIVCGSVLMAMPVFDTPIVAVVAISIGYGFSAMVFPLVNSAISELCPPQQTAGTMGTFIALMAVGGLIAPYATGLIVDNAATPAAGYLLAFQLLGGLGLVAAVLALVFAHPDRDRKLIRERS
ncbi:MFS transporter [Rhodococcus sp. JS3073]|uniref:MFS transporter n=1 Tax=Rhodococcus sp. JS3073 TaxID=3002901 RepID=UPI003FA76C06